MSSFNELISGDTPVLVDFYADWCGPCRMMPPILQEVKNANGDQVNVVKVDVDKNPQASMKYNVRSIPTLIIFRNGEPVWRHTGVASAAQINGALEDITSSAS